VGIGIGKRTGVSRVVVELALLHPLEAKSVPAQRRVRHELRLEFTDCDRRLRRKDVNATEPKSMLSVLRLSVAPRVRFEQED
jgi:hypothetical protein